MATHYGEQVGTNKRLDDLRRDNQKITNLTIAILIVGILTLLIGALTFYWYEWRPTQIKQRCSADARFDRRATLELDDIKRQEFINTYYEDCLMRFGLK
jgi:hypothetical protein